MARDYYADAHEIAERLAESGQHEWCDRIEQVIAEGYAATEILMGIQFQLGELLGSDAVLSDDTRELAVNLRQSIQEALE
jgi:hypothetical protein